MKIQKSRARLDKQGRIVIPVEMRDQLDMRPGEIVTLRVEGDELRVVSVAAGIRRAQAIAAKYTKGRTGLVDEFLRDRRVDSGE